MDSIQTQTQNVKGVLRIAVASDGTRFYGKVYQNESGMCEVKVAREGSLNFAEIRIGTTVISLTLAKRLMQSMLATVVCYHNKKVRHSKRRLSTISENSIWNRTKIEDEHGDIHEAVRRAYK